MHTASILSVPIDVVVACLFIERLQDGRFALKSKRKDKRIAEQKVDVEKEVIFTPALELGQMKFMVSLDVELVEHKEPADEPINS